MITLSSGQLTVETFGDGTIWVDRPNSFQVLKLSPQEAAELAERLGSLQPGPTRRQCWFMAVEWYLDDINGAVDVATPEIDNLLAEEYARGSWPDAAAELAILKWNDLEENWEEDEDGQADED